jgi:hypothetical protein
LENLTDFIVKYAIYRTKHGSDHHTIKTVFDAPRPISEHPERPLLKNAPWKEINAKIARTLDATPSEGTVQQKTDQLISAVLEAVYTLTPKGQTITIRKAMVDNRLDTAPSDIHILKKPRPLGATGGTRHSKPEKDGRKYKETIPRCNPTTKEKALE